MGQMEFKMERTGLLEVGEVLSITEADGETNVELEWIGVAEKDFGDIEDEMDERGMIKYEDYMGVEYDDE